jgi:hypothetical protein
MKKNKSKPSWTPYTDSLMTEAVITDNEMKKASRNWGCFARQTCSV